MTYLLDTHYLVWAIGDSRKISTPIKNIITDTTNEVVVSTISFWEISLKTALKKLKITAFSPEELPAICEEMGFGVVELSASESSSFHRLTATYHKDPFDRMLIWQAMLNDFTLISADPAMEKYRAEGLRLIGR